MCILLKLLRDKGPTDNMNMEDLLDRLLMRLGSHTTGTPSVPSSHQVPLAPTFWYIKHALLLMLLDLVISFLMNGHLHADYERLSGLNGLHVQTPSGTES